MKKLLLILALITMMVGITGCKNENERKLKSDIEATNRQCPVSMGMLGDIISLKYDEKAKEVQLYLSLNEKFVDIDVLKKNRQMVLQNLKLAFSRNNGGKKIMDQMIKAGASLSITYKGSSSGKSFNVKLPLSDLKEITGAVYSDKEVNRILLENQIAMENSRCPYKVAEGMEMVKVFDDGDNIVYSCQFDESMYDLSFLRLNQSELKQNIREIFNDPAVKEETKVLCSLDKGLEYRYYGDMSGDSISVVFTPEELRRY